MIPTTFPQSNRVLTAPDGMPECGDLPVWTDGGFCISRWLPTAEDLEAILNGRPIWLHVACATLGTQPPVALTTDDPFAGQEVTEQRLKAGE